METTQSQGSTRNLDAIWPRQRRAQDHWRVSLTEAWEVGYWMREFECTEAELREAVQTAGCRAGEVRAHLQRG